MQRAVTLCHRVTVFMTGLGLLRDPSYGRLRKKTNGSWPGRQGHAAGCSELPTVCFSPALGVGQGRCLDRPISTDSYLLKTKNESTSQ
jgi:hypothetical protein